MTLAVKCLFPYYFFTNPENRKIIYCLWLINFSAAAKTAAPQRNVYFWITFLFYALFFLLWQSSALRETPLRSVHTLIRVFSSMGDMSTITHQKWRTDIEEDRYRERHKGIQEEKQRNKDIETGIHYERYIKIQRDSHGADRKRNRDILCLK